MKPSSFRSVGAAVALMCMASSTLAAQRTGFELGADAGLYVYSYNSDRPATNIPSRTIVSFPLGSIRLGFKRASPVEPEVGLGFVYSGSSGTSTLSISSELGLVIPITHPAEGQSQIYVRPAIGLDYGNSSGFSSFNRLSLGGSVGVRVPLTEIISARYEVRYAYLAKVNGVSANVLGLRAGLSVFMPR